MSTRPEVKINVADESVMETLITLCPSSSSSSLSSESKSDSSYSLDRFLRVRFLGRFLDLGSSSISRVPPGFSGMRKRRVRYRPRLQFRLVKYRLLNSLFHLLSSDTTPSESSSELSSESSASSESVFESLQLLTFDKSNFGRRRRLDRLISEGKCGNSHRHRRDQRPSAPPTSRHCRHTADAERRSRKVRCWNVMYNRSDGKLFISVFGIQCSLFDECDM